ncbi:hypothetical protein L5B88_29925 [Pseudomonas aeruginosa]|nr:hypothetical protein [Pseudomonas aeruginosa]
MAQNFPDYFLRLILKRDRLIQAESSDDDWSRHASFMVRHVGCGPKPPDYYVSYGYYYCSTYGAKLNPRLSSQGQAWLRNARKNLQENLEDGLADNMRGDEIEIPSKNYPNRTSRMKVSRFELEVINETFKTFAFNTHVPAYLDAGLADLPIGDLLKIGGQPNIEEWLDRETWNQALESGDQVLGDKYNKGKQAIEDAIESLMRHLRW